jgi:hypothetical protein
MGVCGYGRSELSTGIMGGRRAWTVSMISALSMPLQIDRSDAEVGVSELALDDEQRDAVASHLDGMRVAQLVRREAPTHASRGCRISQFGAGRARGPGASADHAEQRSDR